MRGIEAGPRLVGIERRAFLGRTLSLGALTLLTGCDVSDGDTVQRALHAMSDWNDRVQEALFGRARLAPTFGENDWEKRSSVTTLFFPRTSRRRSTLAAISSNSPE